MESPSRRAFLTGRRNTRRSPWEAFISRLRSRAQGSVYDFSSPAGSARLVPGHMQDVYHARALCAEYGVVLALDGLQHAARMEDEAVLWVEPGTAMDRHERLGPDDPRWFVQPGCLVADLETAGLPQFRDQPPHLTVAAWIADRRICDWDSGETAASGLVHAQVLLADGTQANLGAFGVDNRKPLDNRRVQDMIPRLFELSGGPQADDLVVDGRWNGRYRLDALRPREAASLNLAHLLLGHGGELGWVEWLVFDERVEPVAERAYDMRYGRRAGHDPAGSPLDEAVRALFDPDSVFPCQAQVF